MTERKPKGYKLRTTRKISHDAGGASYKETRGIRSLSVGPDGEVNAGRDPAATAKLMAQGATKLLDRLGVTPLGKIVSGAIDGLPNDQNAAIAAALSDWHASTAAKYGVLSVPAMSAKFLGLTYLVTGSSVANGDASEADSINSTVQRMQGVFALCDAWHWLHMEFFGEHELAFGKTDHAEGAYKGAQATAENHAKRAAIVREAIAQLCERTKDKSKLKQASYVARQIRDIVAVDFVVAGLSASKSDEAFDKMVRRIMSEN